MRYTFLLQSLQHAQNSILGKNRFKGFNRKNVASRIDTDGLLQTKYKLVGRTEDELFTKFIVNPLYDKSEDQELRGTRFQTSFSSTTICIYIHRSSLIDLTSKLFISSTRKLSLQANEIGVN